MLREQIDNQEGFSHILVVLLIVVVIGTIGFVGYTVAKKTSKSQTSHSLNTSDTGNSSEQARQQLFGSCSGSGSVKLSVLPMKAGDVSSIIPYGLMVNEHVTPIDHQYFAPARYDSPRDAYEVRAPADGYITDIEHRTSGGGSFYNNKAPDEYRVVISYTCTFGSYFDLLTSLTPNIKSQINGDRASVHIAVKAGDVIGHIGGQTLDFAVWDTTKTLSGYVVPDHYKGEPWKIHTADPLDYVTPELKTQMLALNPRKIEPRSGKIDYDIDGKLSGNWFVQGYGGYTGNGQNDPNNWKNHLAFAPNNYDPTFWEASIGSWGSNAQQFGLSPAAIVPTNVGVSSGLVKYDLLPFQQLIDGKASDGNSTTITGNQTITFRVNNQPQGCLLAQLTSDRILKVETIVGKACSLVSSFDSSAKIYER